MADYDLKTITADTDGPVDDNSVLFGADDQGTATPKPYTFGAIKAWIQSWLGAYLSDGYVSANKGLGAAVALTTATATNILSIDLGVGTWEITGAISFNGAGTTTVSYMMGGISNASATAPSTPDQVIRGYPSPQAAFALTQQSMAVPSVRVTLAAPKTYYLTAYMVFGTSTANAFGKIAARKAFP